MGCAESTARVGADDGESRVSIHSRSQRLLKKLQEIPIVGTLRVKQQLMLVDALAERIYQAGDALMKQGDEGDEFFIINSGACEVIIMNAEGEKEVIAELGPGDYCGEAALLSTDRRNATVAATERTQCMVVNSEAFRDLMGDVEFAKRDNRREGIRRSTSGAGDQESTRQHKATKKNAAQLDWIMQAMGGAKLLQNLDLETRKNVAEQMFRAKFRAGEDLVNEGRPTSVFYLLADGRLEVKNEEEGTAGYIEAGEAYGELALLHKTPAADTLTAAKSSTLWGVERCVFREIVKKARAASQAENVAFLKKVRVFKTLLSGELRLIDAAMEPVIYEKGAEVIRQGDEGDRFYVIKEGTAQWTKIPEGDTDGSGVETGVLKPGGYFGERALLNDEKRAASIEALQKLTCLTLSRRDFLNLMGPLQDIMKRRAEEDRQQESDTAYTPITTALSSLQHLGYLGRGGFGLVSLVRAGDGGKCFALKSMSKASIVNRNMVRQILDERSIMLRLDHPCLVNIKATYSDENYVYFLLEACMGGDLFGRLRRERSFDEDTARFVVAAVVNAFDYIHSKEIIFRDLKPENLVLTSRGYIKVIDFGLAKHLPHTAKPDHILGLDLTYTICGTPDYLAPETLLGIGSSRSVDWWGVGILLYELLASFTPFYDPDQMSMYRKIMTGKVKYPKSMSKESRSLVSKFLRVKPTRRIGISHGGAQCIRDHSWFAGFDWEGFAAQKLTSPFVVDVRAPDDLQNFKQNLNKSQDELEYYTDPQYGWDANF